MSRLGIVVGHTKAAPGAFSKTLNQSEYVYNSDLAEKIKAYGAKVGVEVFIEKRDVGGVTGAFKRILAKKPAAIIELHFNAANGKASGAETLFSDNYDRAGADELALAFLLAKNMAKVLGIPNRGVKERGTKGERGFFNLMQTTQIASVLIESGFGDNPVDAKAMRDKKDALAQTIVDSFTAWVDA